MKNKLFLFIFSLLLVSSVSAWNYGGDSQPYSYSVQGQNTNSANSEYILSLNTVNQVFDGINNVNAEPVAFTISNVTYFAYGVGNNIEVASYNGNIVALHDVSAPVNQITVRQINFTDVSFYYTYAGTIAKVNMNDSYGFYDAQSTGFADCGGINNISNVAIANSSTIAFANLGGIACAGTDIIYYLDNELGLQNFTAQSTVTWSNPNLQVMDNIVYIPSIYGFVTPGILINGINNPTDSIVYKSGLNKRFAFVNNSALLVKRDDNTQSFLYYIPTTNAISNYILYANGNLIVVSTNVTATYAYLINALSGELYETGIHPNVIPVTHPVSLNMLPNDYFIFYSDNTTSKIIGDRLNFFTQIINNSQYTNADFNNFLNVSASASSCAIAQNGTYVMCSGNGKSTFLSNNYSTNNISVSVPGSVNPGSAGFDAAFNKLFPQDISSTAKFFIVLAFIVVSTLLILFLMVNAGFGTMGVIVVAIVDVVELIFFVKINYITIWILAVIGILSLAIIFLMRGSSIKPIPS